VTPAVEVRIDQRLDSHRDERPRVPNTDRAGDWDDPAGPPPVDGRSLVPEKLSLLDEDVRIQPLAAALRTLVYPSTTSLSLGPGMRTNGDVAGSWLLSPFPQPTVDAMAREMTRVIARQAAALQHSCHSRRTARPQPRAPACAYEQHSGEDITTNTAVSPVHCLIGHEGHYCLRSTAWACSAFNRAARHAIVHVAPETASDLA